MMISAVFLLVFASSPPRQDGAQRSAADLASSTCSKLTDPRSEAAIRAAEARIVERIDEYKRGVQSFDGEIGAEGKRRPSAELLNDLLRRRTTAESLLEDTKGQLKRYKESVEGLKAFITAQCEGEPAKVRSSAKGTPSGEFLPESYFDAKLCDDVNDNADALVQFAGEDGKALVEMCNVTAGGGAAISMVLLPIVQGLGDFITARGKEELFRYTLDTLGERVCVGWAGTNPEKNKPEPTTPAYLFNNTCLLLYPDGLESPASVGDLTVARLQQSAERDLAALPGRAHMARLAHKFTTKKIPPDARLTGNILIALGSAIEETARTGEFYRFFRLWRSNVEDILRGSKASCSTPLGSGCTTLFMVKVGAAGEQHYESGQFDNVAKWVDEGLRSFCDDLEQGSDAPFCRLKDDASRAQYLVQLHPYGARIGEFVKKLAAIQTRANSLRDEQKLLRTEVRDRVLPDILDLFKDELTSLTSSASGLSTIPGEIHARAAAPDEPAEVEEDADTSTTDALNAIIAGLRRDYRALFDFVSRILREAATAHKDEKKDEQQLERTLKSLAFLADLAAAEDRETAARVIESAAAPRGKFRMKYERSGASLTLNAYFGPLVGYQRNLLFEDGAQDPRRNAMFFRLAAPIGFDWKWKGWNRAHVGVFFPVIDPLALSTVNQVGQTTNVQWGTLVTPGVFPRVGLLRSPISFLFGVTYHPWMSSKTQGVCSDCWRGAIQVTASFVVDIPLFVLKQW